MRNEKKNLVITYNVCSSCYCKSRVFLITFRINTPDIFILIVFAPKKIVPRSRTGKSTPKLFLYGKNRKSSLFKNKRTKIERIIRTISCLRPRNNHLCSNGDENGRWLRALHCVRVFVECLEWMESGSEREKRCVAVVLMVSDGGRMGRGKCLSKTSVRYRSKFFFF